VKKLFPVLVVASLVAALGGAVQADAAPASARVVLLTSSDQYAVYVQKTSAKNLNPGNEIRGTLFAIDAAGRRRTLGSFTGPDYTVELVGSSLIQTRNVQGTDSSHQEVHYLDLRSGRTGTAVLTGGDGALASAPGGFVRAHRTGETTALGEPTELSREAYDGTQTALGDPFPDGAGFGLAAGDGGLLASTSTNDETPNVDSRIRFMSWSTPGRWRTIYDAHASLSVGCSAPSSTYVACTAQGENSPGPGTGLFRLSDGKVRWLTKSHPKVCKHIDTTTYRSNIVGIETSSAGVCTRGKLIRFSADGKLVASKRHFSALGSIHAGLGRILVDKGDQSVLYTLTGVTRTPQKLTSA
jgi:hypothetical protein